METGYNEEFYGEENICPNCRRRTIDRTENPEAAFCRECREELIKLRIPPLLYLAAGVVVLLVALALYFFVPALKGYAVYESADRRAADGHPGRVLTELYELTEQYPAATKVGIKMADIGMLYSYYDYAGYAIDVYLLGKSVEDEVYQRLNSYYEPLEQYYNTVALVEETVAELAEEAGGTIPEADQEAAVAAFSDKISAGLGDPLYDQALLCYYMGLFAVDLAEQANWLEQALEINPLFFQVAVEEANVIRRMGDLTKAREMVEYAYGIDRDYSQTLRSYAILEMLAGSPEQALEYARTAYEGDPEGNYVVDTFIIALSVAGQPEEAARIKSESEAAGSIFNEDLEAMLSGEMTLWNYYVEE